MCSQRLKPPYSRFIVLLRKPVPTVSFLDRDAMTHAAAAMGLEIDVDALLRRAALGDRPPLFLDEGLHPEAELFQFGLHMAHTLSPLSIRQYAYTARRFVDALAAHGVPLTAVTEQDIMRYRAERLGAGLSTASWATEALVIRRLVDFLVARDVISGRPWIEIGQRSVVSVPVRLNADVRHLTLGQWRAFRDVGLLGMTTDGRLDPGFRGFEPERNRLGAELALTTGMRLREFSTVLTVDVAPGGDEPTGQFTLEACAKRAQPRTVYVPTRTVELARQYIRGNRAAVVRSHQDQYRSRRADLIVVRSGADIPGLVTVAQGDRTRAVALHRLDAAARRRLFIEHNDGHLEPAALFLGRNGYMPRPGTWNVVFNSASRRVATFPSATQVAGGVTPHDLRHTFAVRMMGHLVRSAADAYRAHAQAGKAPDQTIGEAVALNPLLTVQRLLGHASPATTTVYLRYVEDLRATVEAVMAEWDEESDLPAVGPTESL